MAAPSKERDWTAKAEAQGGTFHPPHYWDWRNPECLFSRVSSNACCCLVPFAFWESSFPGLCVVAYLYSHLPGKLCNHSCPTRFSDCPWGCPQTWGPALDSTEATPTCCSLRIPLSHGLRGLVLSQTPRRLGPRSRCLLLGPPPPPHRAPQMPGLSRNGASLPSPTPHVNITERPPQPPPSLRVPVVVCLLCRSSQSVVCCTALLFLLPPHM